MAKDVTKGFTIDLSNPEDPFRLILEGIVNAYATDFENIDDPSLKPSRRIAPGIVDRFGKLQGIGLPYGSESSNKTLTMNSAVKAFEQLGLIKNNPVKAGRGKLIDTYDFTPLMDNVIDQVKTGQLPSEALQSAIPDLRPTPIKAPAGTRKVGQASAAVLENMPDTDLAKDAQKFLEDKGRIAPTPEAEPTRLTAREVLDKIYSSADEDTELERNRAVSEERATRSLLDSSLNKSEDVARNLSAADPSAMEKMGQFLNKNKGKIVKSVAPAVVGGAVGLAAKGAEALDYAMSSKPTGRDPESLSTEQMKALKASIEGGDLTDEQRLATSEFPPEVRDAEYLTEQIAKREQPMKQGAEMQGDLERSTRFQDEMKRLMQQQQQKQGTAQ